LVKEGSGGETEPRIVSLGFVYIHGKLPAAKHPKIQTDQNPVNEREGFGWVVIPERKKKHADTSLWIKAFLATRMMVLDSDDPSPLLGFSLKEESHQRLAIFRSDSGITLSFGEQSYFVESGEPFHNIALKALECEDYVPFYVEIARREGLGPEFRDALMSKAREISEAEE
jgi:hypothetical protein